MDADKRTRGGDMTRAEIQGPLRADYARIDVTRAAVAAAEAAGRHHARDGFTRREQLLGPGRLIFGAFLAGAAAEARRRPDKRT